MSHRGSDSIPPPPRESTDEGCPPPPPPEDNEPAISERPVELDWKQQLVNLSSSFLQLDARTKRGVNIKESIIVTAHGQHDKKKVMFSLTDKQGETHYIQALAPEQRVLWVDNLLEHGSSVVRQPAKLVDQRVESEIKGWIKIISPSYPNDRGTLPSSLNPLVAATNRVLNERKLAKNSVNQEILITKLQREINSKDQASEVGRLKMENNKLNETNSRLTHSMSALANTVTKLETDKTKYMEEHTAWQAQKVDLENKIKGAEGGWADLLTGDKTEETEKDALKKEIERLMGVNQRLVEDIARERSKTSTLQDQSQLIKELHAERDDLTEQVQELVQAKEQLEQSAEEVIADLTKEKETAEEMLKAAQDDILELKAQLASGEGGSGDAAAATATATAAAAAITDAPTQPKDLTAAAKLLSNAGGAGLAALVMAGVDFDAGNRRRGSIVSDGRAAPRTPNTDEERGSVWAAESETLNNTIKELEQEKQALLEELCDEKEENNALRKEIENAQTPATTPTEE